MKHKKIQFYKPRHVKGLFFEPFDELEERCTIDDKECNEKEIENSNIVTCKYGKWNRTTQNPPCKPVQRKKKSVKSTSQRKTHKCKK